MGPDVVVPIAGMAMVVAIVLGVPLVRARVKQMERGVPDSAGLAEMQQRLERIEQAIDAMAVEVERIAEGQRFVTRLLAEKGQERPGLTI